MSLPPVTAGNFLNEMTDRIDANEGHGHRERAFPMESFESHRAYLTNLAAVLLCCDMRSRLCPADLVQETLIVAYFKYDRFRGESNDQFRNWLEGILRRKNSEAMRKFRRTGKSGGGKEISYDAVRSIGMEGDPPDPLNEEEENAMRIFEQLELLREEIRKLPAIDQALIEGKLIDDLTIAEIARQIGLSVTNAYQRFGRARKTLKMRLSARFAEMA